MPNVYCDLDGVLVDLMKGFRDINDGVCLSVLDNAGLGDSKWNPAIATPKFWETLPKMPDADVLLDYFQETVPSEKLHVLSAPQHCFPDCGIEKMRWVDLYTKQTFRIHRVNIVKRKYKPHFALNADGSPNILIDDYDKNVAEWEAAGGIAIHHTSAESSIEALSKYY